MQPPCWHETRSASSEESPPKLGAEFREAAQPRQGPEVALARGPGPAGPHPTGREPQVSDKLTLPQERAPRAHCGATCCRRGPSARNCLAKGPEKETKPPCHPPNPQPTSSETDALSLGLLSHCPRRLLR